MTSRLPAACAVAILALAAAPAAAECRAASGEHLRPLVELYTSEGCSSCPPADRWFAATFAADGAPAVALAFHVDYWNRLGWPDRFARSDWTARQSELSRATRNPVVYTPQVALQGRDLRDWREGGFDEVLAREVAAGPRADLVVVARIAGGRVRGEAEATPRAASDRSRARVVVAYVDSGHVTDVMRGENRGARLAHDHVVRELAVGATTARGGSLRNAFDFALPDEAGTAPRLVAFVEREDTRAALQAVVLPLEGCR
jgi:hypothetical protein